MQAIKKIYWRPYDNFLKQKCLNITICKVFCNKKKYNTINIKFKFRILEAPVMEENMDTEILIS